MFGGAGTLSDRFCDFVHYRIRHEVKAESGCDARDIGLDSRTVADMVKISVAYFAPRYVGRNAFSLFNGDGFHTGHDGAAGLAIVLIIVAAIYVGPAAWDRADGNLLALPYFAVLELVEVLRRALLGLGSIIGLR